MRSTRGQATPEYVAIVLVVAVVLGTAAAVTSGGLGGAAVNGLRRGLCALTGRACAPLPVAGDLPPCLVHAREDDNDLVVSAGVIDLGRDRSLRVERFSDGHVEVTFGSGGAAGLVAQLGGTLRAGDQELAAQASVGVHLHVGGGRTWRFAGRRAAAAFVRRWAGRQTVAGGLVHDAHALCVLCTLVGAGPRAMPLADVVWHGGGHDLGASADLRGLGLGGGARATMEAQTLGVREDRRGGRTRYLALSDALAGALAPYGEAHRGSALVLELHEDRRGRPDVVALRSVATAGRGTAETIREVTWSLALRAGEDVRALRALLARPLPRSRLAALLAVRPFLARVAAACTTTVRRLRAWSEHGGTGFGDTLKVGAGAGVELDGRDEQLLSEEVTLPGGRTLPRAGCPGRA